MNERLKELILEAGFPTFGGMYVVSSGEELEHFAELVRADEREECAALCSAVAAGRDAEAIEEAILARGGEK